MVIQLILNNETPQTACTQLKFCTSSAFIVIPSSGPYCQYCQAVVSAAEKFLTENTTEAEIKLFFMKLCSRLPPAYEQPVIFFFSY
jgi:hypothetical protein